MGLTLSVLSVLFGVVAIAVTVNGKSGQNGGSPRGDNAERVAPRGALTLPQSMPAGRRDFQIPTAEASVIPRVREDEFGTPSLTDAADRRFCDASSCEFELGVSGAVFRPPATDFTSVPHWFYVSRVYAVPATDPIVAAASSSADGADSVVVDAPFLRGWFCFRATIVFGSPTDNAPRWRTPWSAAKCYYLDDEGYVVRTAARP